MATKRQELEWDVWEMTVSRLIDDWDALRDIPNVKNNHPEKVEHPCQYPVELAERILALTNEGDIVYDPFAGGGSSYGAQERPQGLRIEWEQFVDTGLDRLVKVEGGLLTRPIHREIWRPRLTNRPRSRRMDPGTMKIAQVYSYLNVDWSSSWSTGLCCGMR